MKNVATDYIAWLFFPSRFLFPQRSDRWSLSDRQAPPIIRVLGWENLQLKVDPEELTAFNTLVGETFLAGSGNAFLEPLFGKHSAFTLDGPEHRLARRLISQAINRASIEQVVEHMPDFLDRELANMTEGRQIRVGKVMRRVTMRAMCLAILGVTDETVVQRLLGKFEAATGYFANLVSYNKAFWKARGKLSVGAEVERRTTAIDDVILEMIDHRRAIVLQEGVDDHSPRDLLSHLLLSQTVHGYSDVFIRDNLVATLAAGYDTTGSAITWMLFWLGKDMNSRLDLCAYYGTDTVEYDRHAEAFISEVMRYCPPLEILPRRPVREQAEAAHLDEPTLVCPCPHQIHHSSTVYGDPAAFRPGRFLDRKFAPTEYFPFGLGNRLCLGINLARRILRVTLDWCMDTGIYLEFRSTKFRPIRRNVSLWPSFRTTAKLMRLRNFPERESSPSARCDAGLPAR
ncbi:MAG: cytochrome P450 [Sphingomonadales bacterium]|nr:cytochrome P450 [Sphingomonadales bacterium]